MQDAVEKLERYLGVKRDVINLAERWSEENPSGTGLSLAEYLKDVRTKPSRAGPKGQRHSNSLLDIHDTPVERILHQLSPFPPGIRGQISRPTLRSSRHQILLVSTVGGGMQGLEDADTGC